MKISAATANLYFLPFERALAIIAEAGFANIELDLYWERKEWAMAQHLKGVPVAEALGAVERSGLRISSIHDGGGVLESGDSIGGYINPALRELLDILGHAPDCLVFHTPHWEAGSCTEWQDGMSEEIAGALHGFSGDCSFVTIENMPGFEGYCVPMRKPEELATFAQRTGLGVTLDTTHYAQVGIDIAAAATILGSSVGTVHFSDYAEGRAHLFPGEGELDFPRFFGALDFEGLRAVTLECSLFDLERARGMSDALLAARLREARLRLEFSLAQLTMKEAI